MTSATTSSTRAEGQAPSRIRFSVVTTTWDRLALLRENVASLRAQDYSDFEQIFVDGGSTDGTLKWLAGLQGDVKVLEGITGGIARAMNAGLQAATGDVVLHLHSDDYLPHPRILSRVAAVFEKTGCDWMYGRCLTDLSGAWTPESNHFPKYHYRRLIQGDIIPHPATYVHRRLFQRVGWFDENLRYAMDYDMWLRMGKIAEPVQLKEFLAVFRSHSGSATHSNRIGSARDEHMVRKRYLSRNPLLRFNYDLRFIKRLLSIKRDMASKENID